MALPGYSDRIVGRCPALNQQYLPREDVLVSGIYDNLWRQQFVCTRDERIARKGNLRYRGSAFRVIQSTKPCMERALYSLLDHEPGSISPRIWDLICEYYPLMKKTKPVVRISDNPTLDLDPDIFAKALGIYRDAMRKYYGPQLVLANSIQNLDSAPGPAGKAAGYGSKKELLEGDSEYCFEWADREEPMHFGISGKVELIKEKKYKEGRIRPFEPQDAASHFECAHQFAGSNKRMSESGPNLSAPIAVGWVQQKGGFISLMNSLNLSRHVFSGDADGWDKRFEQLLWQLEFAWRLENAVENDYFTLTSRRGEDTLIKLYQRIFDGYSSPLVWIGWLGLFVRLYIMPSGCTLTSYANSSGHFFIQAYHYAESAAKAFGESYNVAYTTMMSDVCIKLYGDDNLGGVNRDSLIPFYTYDARARTYARFAQRLKKDDDLYTDSPVGHMWLGFRCGENLAPKFNSEKILCSMEWPTSALSPPERYMKTVCLMVNGAYSDPPVYDYLQQHLQDLVETFDSPWPNLSGLSKSSIPTPAELRSFWTGQESGSRPEILALLEMAIEEWPLASCA